MVDWYGHWTYREDDPQEKWCLYDYLARQIISSGYEPKTNLEKQLSEVGTKENTAEDKKEDK